MPETKYITDVPPTLKEAQTFVGGWVELITVGSVQYLVNEEGRLRGLLVNRDASQMCGRLLVGNVMVLSHTARWT